MAGNWSELEYSEALGMRYSIHRDGRAMTEDRVIYNPDELRIIERRIGVIDLPVHMIKDIFDGVVVEPEEVKAGSYRIKMGDK